MNTLEQWFSILLHLRTPWQPIYVHCTRHVIEMFVINMVTVISNLYLVTVNK
jgi:hypothetical protein